jgi:hypothetical protein
MRRLPHLLFNNLLVRNAPGTQSRGTGIQIQPTDVMDYIVAYFATQLQDIEYIIKNSETHITEDC